APRRRAAVHTRQPGRQRRVGGAQAVRQPHGATGGHAPGAAPPQRPGPVTGGAKGPDLLLLRGPLATIPTVMTMAITLTRGWCCGITRKPAAAEEDRREGAHDRCT